MIPGMERNAEPTNKQAKVTAEDSPGIVDARAVNCRHLFYAPCNSSNKPGLLNSPGLRRKDDAFGGVNF